MSKAEHCVTHHDACDCRQARVERLVAAAGGLLDVVMDPQFMQMAVPQGMWEERCRYLHECVADIQRHRFPRVLRRKEGN